MNHLEEDNKKLKIENRNIGENDFLDSGTKSNISEGGENDFLNKNNTSSISKKNKSGNGKEYKKKLIKK